MFGRLVDEDLQLQIGKRVVLLEAVHSDQYTKYLMKSNLARNLILANCFMVKGEPSTLFFFFSNLIVLWTWILNLTRTSWLQMLTEIVSNNPNQNLNLLAH
ncbi:hypothetical protein D5086_030098 [Populus alba]|uniref:Uncharacterized protein n=1 Tax=Populus alba TaxID=43335 RepID=A0ACC4AMI8_POPAL